MKLLIEKKVVKSIASFNNGGLRKDGNFKRPNEVLQSYLKSNPRKTIFFFRFLQRESPSAIDSYSLLYVIKACTKKGFESEGRQIHGVVLKMEYEPNNILLNSLVNMYSSSGNLVNAHQVFDEMPSRNAVCWTSLIAAYVNNRRAKKGLELFRQMQLENVGPDQVTLTVALSACADVSALALGEQIHSYMHRKSDIVSDLSLENALINMYVKCGDVGKAKDVFNNVKQSDVRTWTAMIVGYAINGRAEEALNLFAAMENRSIIPNHVTFIGVLMACSYAGMLEAGKRHFRAMADVFLLEPRLPHYGCMVDLFCRCGMLKDAYEFVLAMPVEPNAVVWRTLLSACGPEGSLDIARAAREKLRELGEGVAGDDVAMSNIYAAKGMWDEKHTVRDEIRQRRIPGRSTVQV